MTDSTIAPDMGCASTRDPRGFEIALLTKGEADVKDKENTWLPWALDGLMVKRIQAPINSIRATQDSKFAPLTF